MFSVHRRYEVETAKLPWETARANKSETMTRVLFVNITRDVMMQCAE